MNDPYAEVEDFRKAYFRYFSRLFRCVRKISFRGSQVNYLFYFVRHPQTFAYHIEPGRKGNESNYRRATRTLKQLHKLGLIEVVESRENENTENHGSINYSLTDEGILFLIKNTELPHMTLLQELIKNYHKSNIFRYLISPYIKLDTLCSPKMKLNLAGIGNFLLSCIQKMDHTLLLLEKEERSERKQYSWNYEKLEDYLRNKYRLDFLDLRYTEEEFDDDHEEIRYFDSENYHRDVKIKFDKKSGRGYALVREKKVKKHIIPLITDYLKKRIITQEEYIANHFDAFCSPRAEEFIVSVILEYPIDTTDDDVREILSNDKSFMKALKETKGHFDRAYRQIISYPDFMF